MACYDGRSLRAVESLRHLEEQGTQEEPSADSIGQYAAAELVDPAGANVHEQIPV